MNNNNLRWPRLPLLAAMLAVAAAPVAAAAERTPPRRLIDLSIEELSEVEVTSASRRPEPLSAAAAAIFVITAEDIRRSGATSIPETLRLVPGLQVASQGSRRWAITARGFNGEFANKLLVLIDGRSVYTPVHSGVNWDAQDTLLTDIERIEVIRGPGASQWGANAVNGVINIITRSAHDTHGGLATVTAGTELAAGAARWGGSLGEDASYRAYAKYFDRDEARTDDGDGAGDDWWQGRTGFRTDWNRGGQDRFTVQGDLYQSDEDPDSLIAPLIVPADRPTEFDKTRGGNLLGRWSRAQSADNEFSLQTYLDWYEANPLLVREQVITFDLDFQHRFRLDAHQQLIWGLGYRHIRDKFDDSPGISFDPSRRTSEIFSGFLQDTIALTDTLALTVGSRFEHNDYTGVEIQPSAQLAWTPDARHTVWGSVSRAVRTPSRGERDLDASLGGGVIRFRGNPDLEAEKLLAYELGYRVSPIPQLFLDLTVYHHDYDDVVGSRYSVEGGGVTGEYANGVAGDASGLELAARWQALPGWRLDLAYTYMDLQVSAPDLHPESEAHEYLYPEHQLSLFSRLDLGERVQLDGLLRYVDRLPGWLPSQEVPSYTELDLRLGWQARPDLSVSLVGQNLLNARHAEFSRFIEIERSVYLRLDQRF